VRDHQAVAVGMLGFVKKATNQFSLKMFQSIVLLFSPGTST
jgi:hypothetical protein